jgi:DNA polymerase I-like protein with 3'-5' exonuclease and polymerase domains/uracil-DNA glycosylase
MPPSGPVPAQIMIVGEAPGDAEMLRREPFVGSSGQELNRMLHEAGIMRSECFLTNVCRTKPRNGDINEWITFKKKQPDTSWTLLNGAWCHPEIISGVSMLSAEMSMVQPNIVIAFGNVALWALTGKLGMKSWRGSLLQTSSGFGSRKVIPCYHPAYVLRDWSVRQITVQDLRRVRRQSEFPEITPTNNRFIIRPSFAQTAYYLTDLLNHVQTTPTTLSVDIETRAGHIACLGIARDRVEAFCIPFMCVERNEGYWHLEEETEIVRLLQRVLCHPNARCIGQNFIYDSQYIYRHWGFVPNFSRDTMLGHHCQFVGLPKGLDFLSSMYCENHVYWKDEGKTWDKNTGEEQLWTYNGKDCVITYEVDEAIQKSIDALGLRKQHDFQMSMFEPVLEAMIRGVRVDIRHRAEFAMELSDEIAKREQYFIDILGHPLNPKSPLQMKRLFYEDLKQKEIFNRKTGTITLNDEALQKIGSREPLLRPLVRAISEFRSLGVFLSTFVNAKLDNDQRLRCSYNIAGTETFRLSSSQNAFDSGLNLQNIPKGGSTEKDNPDALRLPNVRTLFIPDPGYTFFDCDLDRADLQVVVWEAEDEELRQMLREGIDIHAENAKTLGVSRQLAKSWVHGTNYGGSARTMAINCGISVHQADFMRTRWFSAHPGIARWHKRTEDQIRHHRYVTNIFGYRRYYFERTDGILPEALAWQPQSTVALVINKIWRKIYDEAKEIQVLLQVHDSLAGQFPTHLAAPCGRKIQELAREVIVPYPTPLVIPLGLKTSTKSWGDCETL